MKKSLLLAGLVAMLSCSVSVAAESGEGHINYGNAAINISLPASGTELNETFYPVIQFVEGGFTDFTVATSEVKASPEGSLNIVLKRQPVEPSFTEPFKVVLIGDNGRIAKSVSVSPPR